MRTFFVFPSFLLQAWHTSALSSHPTFSSSGPTLDGGHLSSPFFVFTYVKTSSSEMCKIAIKFAFMTFIFSFYKTKFTDNLRHHHPFSRSSTDYACYQFIKSLIPFPFLCVCFFHFPINIFPMRKNGHLIVIDMYDNDKE